MLKGIRVKLARLRAKIKQIRFNTFKHRVTIEIVKIPDDQRIAWLTNRLLNEIEAQGNVANTAKGNCDLFSIFIHYNDVPNFSIESSRGSFSLKGERDITI